MKNRNLAFRYARALYSLAQEKGEADLVFNQMRTLGEVLETNEEIRRFLFSPVVQPAEKQGALNGVTAKIAFAESLKSFILLLAKKNRLRIFHDIVNAYQQISDEAHGVTRGTVRSATVLAPEERKRIEAIVSRATGKQVILIYREDPSLLGGLTAEVGSFTFDDSLRSHLRRINEQLTRRAH